MEQVVNSIRLAICATALSCTASLWDLVKGSRTWEEKSCWCAREVAWRSTEQAGLLRGNAWHGACVLLASRSNVLQPGRSPHPAPAAASAAFHSSPLKQRPCTPHPGTPRLCGDQLPGERWWGLWDMCRGKAGGGEPQGWAPLAKPDRQVCLGGSVGQDGQQARLQRWGELWQEKKGLWQQPGGKGLVGGAWRGRRDIACPIPCTRRWEGHRSSRGSLPIGTLCQGQTCKMFCSSRMPSVPALHTSTFSMLSITAMVCEGDRVLGAALEARGGRPWPCGAQEGTLGQGISPWFTLWHTLE